MYLDKQVDLGQDSLLLDKIIIPVPAQAWGQQRTPLCHTQELQIILRKPGAYGCIEP
jgi:hypothetical protein